MEPLLSTSNKDTFLKYLDKSSHYFEFGSGGSTYQASIRDNIKHIYSVESDIEWQNLLKDKIKKNNITYFFCDIDTQPNNWGYPGKNASNIQKINYSNQMKYLTDEEKKKIDFIFIDGRFRASCCLKCFYQMQDDCIIAFDDFLNRPEYHIVLQYFDIIEQSENEFMVILKKKKNIDIPYNVILKYELDEY